MDALEANSTSLPAYSGFLFLIGSSVFYGSNYLPTGDGMFFQLILCIAIWTVGFVTGNVNTVPIIRTIGIGLGLIIWCSLELIIGWATARFGFFGLDANVPSSLSMNYIGIVLALISFIFYIFVKSETSKNQVDSVDLTNSTQVLKDSDVRQSDFFGRLNSVKKRIVGISLAAISGILYGQSNTPVLYTAQIHESKNYLDYVLSYYTGILLASLGYFVIYSALKKNKPIVYPQVILPGLLSGWMWGVANVCYFLATNALNQAISFPISTCGPPIVASFCGIVLYKEIKGKRNLIILGAGFSVAIAASILIGLST
ncbi:transmembrane protein -like [Brachionus plicatilis]|uniref:Transmembrane protein-like n=1 Tax=Brachionus plicatilis TaxID=10195 RepID=A0A3M7Q5A2_BRAPC|nr:transmembrane protein -like [Brachionus plicatilis]